MEGNEKPLLPMLRFAAYAALPDDQMDLAVGALLIADLAYPTLNHVAYLHRLDALAGAVRAELNLAPGALLPPNQVSHRSVAMRVLRALRRILADREGFVGNREDYYDPRNSYLNDVLDRKQGIPISLSAVYIIVGRCLGAPLEGVGLPAHFVAKWPLPPEEGGGLFIDGFSAGEVMDEDDCAAFVQRLIAPSGVSRLDPRWFEAVGTRAILTRMLNNLKLVYLQRGETTPALAVVDRLIALRPDLAQELRDRGLLRLALGEPLLAAADLATYADRAPQAPEMARLRKRLATIGEIHNKLN
ncbi:MAG TPA: transglutaminase-like domain-containing protein [Ktedonobacterales bacterium]|nr:transglutaminase-like domain-containing protein [Ktedonobacterales bacterium]